MVNTGIWNADSHSVVAPKYVPVSTIASGSKVPTNDANNKQAFALPIEWTTPRAIGFRVKAMTQGPSHLRRDNYSRQTIDNRSHTVVIPRAWLFLTAGKLSEPIPQRWSSVLIDPFLQSGFSEIARQSSNRSKYWTFGSAKSTLST